MGRPFIKSSIALLLFAAAICGKADAAPLNYTVLKLKNGWASYGNLARDPAAAVDSNDIVHLKGAMYEATGNNPVVFILPAKFRPNNYVYVPVNLLDSATGRLAIFPDGSVYIVAANPSDAQTFTSLEGVTYPRN